jgi:hypothetical protein
MINQLKNNISISINEICNYYEDLIEKLKRENEVLKLDNYILSKPGDGINITMLIFGKDNGEGVMTEECIGVFSNKSKALECKKDLIKKSYNINNLFIDETEFKFESDMKDVWVNYSEHEYYGSIYRTCISLTMIEDTNYVSEKFTIS